MADNQEIRGNRAASTAAKRPRRRVAIIGGGPTGRAAARQLAEQGVIVTLFEKETEAGGLMRYGYPGFRMPTEVSRRDVRSLEELGVSFRYNQELGRTVTLDQLTRRFDAVLLAVGAPRPRRLEIPGEDLAGVYGTLEFLYQARSDDPPSIGQRVLVVGGGDTAVDAATSARRLGSAEVTLMYRGQRSGLSIQPHEQRRATAESVTFRFDARPQRINLGDQGLEVVIAEGGRQLTESFDTVIVAIGQDTDTPFLRRLGLSVRPDGSTDRTGVFTAGGARYGSDRLARAIQDGRRAAASVLASLNRS